MQGKGPASKLRLKSGIGLMIALIMIISGLSAIMSDSRMDDSLNVSASGINNPAPTNTVCNVSYFSIMQFSNPQSSTTPGNIIPSNFTGDYLQIVSPGYYTVTMACTNHQNNVFLSLSHNGMQVMQNSTNSVVQIGVNTSTGGNIMQIVNFYWHDSNYQDSGVIALLTYTNSSNGSNPNPGNGSSGSNNNPVNNTVDTTPRISMWPGKVNQHNWNGTWLTDPDGSSGGHPSTSFANDYGDRKVEYCQKWWPNTYAVKLMPQQETITFYTAGNAVGYNSTRDVYECLMTPVNQEWIEFGFSNNHSNYVGVGESLEGEYSVGFMTPGVNYNVNLTVWRDNGTLFQTHSYVESTTFTSNDENAYGIYNNAEHSDWIPLAAGAPGQYNMNGDCFYAIAALFGNGTYITETIFEFSVTTLDCDYHYNSGNGSQGGTTPVTPPPTNGNQSSSGSNNTGNGTYPPIGNGTSSGSGNNSAPGNGNGCNHPSGNGTSGNSGGAINPGNNGSTLGNNSTTNKSTEPITNVNPEEMDSSNNGKLVNSVIETLSEAMNDLSLEEEAALVSAGVGVTTFSLIGLISRFFTKGII